MANHICANGLQEHRNMLHCRSSDSNNGSLHHDSDSELRLHLKGDMLDAAFWNPDQSLLDDWVWAEDGEIVFGDDLELHPRYLAEHDRKFLFDLDDDELSFQDTQEFAQVKTTGFIAFLVAIVDEAFSDEEEAFIEDDRPACLTEAAGTPLELSVYVADVLWNRRGGSVAVAFFALEVWTGVLDQKLTALAGRQKFLD